MRGPLLHLRIASKAILVVGCISFFLASHEKGGDEGAHPNFSYQERPNRIGECQTEGDRQDGGKMVAREKTIFYDA